MSDQYDRVLIRLSSAEDDKLEPILAKLLPLVFDELLTQTEAASRVKIVNVLNHVLTRAKGNVSIKLPALAIAERWYSPKLATSTAAPFFRNLSIIFLDLSVPRLSPIEQIDLALYVLEHFGELLPGADRVVQFLAAIPGLGQAAAEGHRKEQVARSLALLRGRPADDPGLVAFFNVAAEFLVIPCGATEAPSVGGMASTSWAHWKTRLKTKSSADMIALKTSVLKWLGAMGADPPASLVYLPSLVATVENYDAVCNLADSNCKRLDPELDLAGDTALVGRLICGALTAAPPGKEDVTGSLRVEPKATVPSKLRQKVVALLQRSKAVGSPELVEYVVHLVRQSLRDHEQVQVVALQLSLVLAECVDPDKLVDTSTALLKEVETVFWQNGVVAALGPATPLAFRVFGGFARQLAERPGGEGRALALKSAPQLLNLLATNEGSAQDILEALSGLVTCMRGTTEDEYGEFVPLLDRLVTSRKPVVRREVLRWATTLFPTSAPEGRYYALRLFGDADPDIAKSADNALSAGGREVPPFLGMCSFLAARALGPSGEGDRLAMHSGELAKQAPALPALAVGFERRDIARGLSFLLGLADAEGLRSAGEDGLGVPPPQAKRMRLSEAPTGEGVLGGPMDPLVAFVALLDYVLAEVVEGTAAAATDTMEDGSTRLELGLKGLLLAASLASNQATLLQAVVLRAELALLGTGASCGSLFREGGAAANRARRIGARVLGTLCEQFAQASSSPMQKWLGALDAALDAPAGSSRRGGAVLAACELLRMQEPNAGGLALCSKALRLLLPDVEADAAVLAAACDGLRRLSERRPLVWEALEAAGSEGSGAMTRQSLLDRLYDFSKMVTSALGDTKTTELGALNRELVHSSWRLLGQLAAWGGEGSADCIEKLVAIGRQSPGEEATAALGLALVAAVSDPRAAQGQVASSNAGALLQKLLSMAGATADSEEKEPKPPTDEASKAALLERETNQRCGVVWLTVLLRCFSRSGHSPGCLYEAMEHLCRSLVRAIGGLSIFVADCSLKALCHLYCLTPAESRAELMKNMFSSISNRTTVSNMFVGTPDTQARKEANEAADKASGPNSLKITAKERIDLLKDMMFLARELQHPALFIGLLDQPVGSVWTGEVLREALDLQAPCLPDSLHEQLCPKQIRPKLYPYFFHPNGPLRHAVVKLTAGYFSVESPQHLASKFPEEWPLIAKNLVSALGAARVTTREAAVQAAQVLFRGKVWTEVAFIFEDLWTIIVKLMDDMEEKIQAVVKPLVRMLRNLTLRVVDPKLGPKKDAEEAMKAVVPLLLKFCDLYKHAQPLCFDVMREMVKAAHGTNLMSPYVQDLVPPLLVSLSSMEHTSLQYYQFHIDAANEDKGKELEAARISNSRDSESMKLIRQLVPLVTAENAEELAPRTRDSLHRGVGANTRVGVCDFWVAVCAERPSAVPTSGAVAGSMLRSSAGALLDPSREVRSAAASCFASFARRNAPQDLTKVIFERLLKHDQEYRTDEVKRNGFRVSLARALWEVCRRCDDEFIEAELKAAIAAKAFGLRWSLEQEVKTNWESLWNEVCPTTSGGVEKYYREICAELSESFADSISRTEKINMSKAVSALGAQLDKMLPRPKWAEDPAVAGLQRAVLTAVQTLPVFDGNGLLVRALADMAALLHRRKRNEAAQGPDVDEAAVGLPLIRGFCEKGSLPDRGAAVKALNEAMSATRLWGALSEVEQLHTATSKHIDALQKEDEAEEREPGEAPPKRHRGKGQSPAEELLAATLDLWASSLQQCRREVEDEGDLDPPEAAELKAFIQASLSEFTAGSLTMRLAIVRLWKHVFSHFKEERIAVCPRLELEMCSQIAIAIQDASLDQRSERLRRPALEFASALAQDAEPGGGREALTRGLAAATAADAGPAPRTVPLSAWLAKLDPTTAEQCAEQLKALRALAGAA